MALKKRRKSLAMDEVTTSSSPLTCVHNLATCTECSSSKLDLRFQPDSTDMTLSASKLKLGFNMKEMSVKNQKEADLIKSIFTKNYDDDSSKGNMQRGMNTINSKHVYFEYKLDWVFQTITDFLNRPRQ